MLIVLVGARGAGKSTLLGHLGTLEQVEVLKPSTTRAPRDENEQEYEFVNDWDPERYAWSIRVGTQYYGTRLSEVEKARERPCLTVFDPLNIDHLQRFRQGSDLHVVTVGLDTIKDVQGQKGRVGGDPSREMTARDFELARNAVLRCDVVLSGDEETVLAAAKATLRVLTSRGGLLVEEDIAPLVRAGVLLEGANPNEIRSASYDLRLGDQIWCQGELVGLTSTQTRFDIPPYSYAIVIAHETAALPTFVTARFDIKVSLFLNGIILSNGPQVDPGYRGALFCMLFNGSSKPRTLIRGTHFSTIEFTTTTHPTKPYDQQYQLRERLDRVMSEDAIAGPGGTIIETMREELNSVRQRVEKVKNAYWAGIGIILTALGIPAAILFAMMWDKVKDAREEVSKLQETRQTLTSEMTNQKDQAVQAIRDATSNAIQEISQMPSRPSTPNRAPSPPPRP